MKSFIILVLLGVIACLIGTRPPDIEPAPPAVAVAAATVAPTPPPAVVSVNPSAAVIVRGVVLAETDGGVIVNCDARHPNSGLAAQQLGLVADVRTSKAGIASLAGLAREMEEQEAVRYFGPLQMWGGRSFQSAPFVPSRSLSGSVHLVGFRAKPQHRVNLVAALRGSDPKGRAVYTAILKMSAGSWMWTKRENTLNQAPRR